MIISKAGPLVIYKKCQYFRLHKYLIKNKQTKLEIIIKRINI